MSDTTGKMGAAKAPKQPTSRNTIENTNAWSTKQLVTMALMCAISVLLSFVEFPIFPSAVWLKYDASFVPAMVCGFAYGPAAGLAVGAIAALLHGMLMANFAGAIMNILAIVGFVLPAALIYKRVHTFKGAAAGLIVGIIGALAMAIVGNLIITPNWLGVPFEAVTAMILPILLPFNLLKGALNSVLTLLTYKAVSNLITPKKNQVKGR